MKILSFIFICLASEVYACFPGPREINEAGHELEDLFLFSYERRPIMEIFEKLQSVMTTKGVYKIIHLHFKVKFYFTICFVLILICFFFLAI